MKNIDESGRSFSKSFLTFLQELTDSKKTRKCYWKNNSHILMAQKYIPFPVILESFKESWPHWHANKRAEERKKQTLKIKKNPIKNVRVFVASVKQDLSKSTNQPCWWQCLSLRLNCCTFVELVYALQPFKSRKNKNKQISMYNSWDRERKDDKRWQTMTNLQFFHVLSGRVRWSWTVHTVKV